MSFLPSDLASWALRSVRATRNAADETNTESNQQQQQSSQIQQQVDEQDIRAKRLARLSAAAAATSSKITPMPDPSVDTVMADVDAMEVEPPSSSDKESTVVSVVAPMEVDDIPETPPSITPTSSSSNSKRKSSVTPSTTALGAGADRRRRRKKEMLVQKILRISLLGGCLSTSVSSESAAPCVVVDIGPDPIIVDQNISEVLATRLALSSDALAHVPAQDRNFILYLASCHRRASEELKNMVASPVTPSSENEAAILQRELIGILEEMIRQIVSYAASTLLEPDLFEMGKDGHIQLARALVSSTLDPISSITYCVSGKGSSFMTCLCEELLQANEASFTLIVHKVVQYLSSTLTKIDSVLDETLLESNSSPGNTPVSSRTTTSTDDPDGQHLSVNGLVLVSALSALSSSHKKVVAVITSMPNFLLPPLNSPAAAERVSNEFSPFPPGDNSNGNDPQRFIRMMMAMSRGNRGASAGYLRRSGPALEKETLLGSILKVGLPMDHPHVFSSFKNAATKTVSDISKANDGLRKQLAIYQEAVHSLIRSWITAGEDCRKQVMQFVIDALLVNVGADAFRPDKTKVCQTHTLINLSTVLLKLCEPFIHDPTRIDCGFISSPNDHGGVFPLIGELAVSRLGENETLVSNPNIPIYEPKNAFIPQVFFFCARSIHFGLASSASYHTTLTRQVNHTMWNLRQRNADAAVDPALNHLLTLQYSNEVTILSPSVLEDSLNFVNLVAGVILRARDDNLPYIPEHFVDDVCDILVFVARFQPKVLEKIDLGDVFRVAVKLLSPQYAHVVRNYNLRAKLGDVLHDVYLPPEKDSRWSVPESVSCDPFAGGSPYLISDMSAKETLAPSLLLLYGEVEHTGFYDKMGHRANIASLLKYLWDSGEHRQAFRRITQNKDSFIKFANGVMNENNSLITNVMEKLQDIRRVQLQLSTGEWASLSEELRETITSRHEENEQEVKRALPLCNKTLQMLGYLNTDSDIRRLFLLEEMCPRLVNMLLHVVTKLVGSKGMDLKVDNPETYNFRPKEMLRDLCSILASFTDEKEFQVNCAKSGYYSSELLDKTVKTCTKLNLLTDVSMQVLNTLPIKVEAAARFIEDDEAILADAPEEFLDPLMFTFMRDPVFLPTSGNIVDRSTITQHLLNDAHDPFNRKELTLDMVEPAIGLKKTMDEWILSKRSSK